MSLPGILWSILIPALGLSLFAYLVIKRLGPMIEAKADPRSDRIPERFFRLFKFAIFQYRQPRYLFAGLLHIFLFAGFIILSIRSLNLILLGMVNGYVLPSLKGSTGHFYSLLKDLSSTVVLIICVIAMIRRGIVKPVRYRVPPKYGKEHTGEALAVLSLISGLMLCDMIFDGTAISAALRQGGQIGFLFPVTGTWVATRLFRSLSFDLLQSLHLISFYLHDFLFFFFLCFLPFGKHFHVITSLPNVFLMKLNKGSIKPVQWDIEESEMVELKSVGIKKLEDFTWKHILDFYSCADCGRCSDQCPANAVGRPLSPRFISIKCRDHAFQKYPVIPGKVKSEKSLIGQILEENEIWSCTTCGACEEECPLSIEYIDKIVDLRRGLVDDGLVPQSLQKPLQSIEKRGNPYGKPEKKRADWIEGLADPSQVKILGQGTNAPGLYFVDSITSYDDRAQEIARSTVRVLRAAGIDFGILGAQEKDSGHEVRRFGEEMLFIGLKSKNTKVILESGVKQIITSDPHAFNCLKNDYPSIPRIEHITQIMERKIKSGDIRLRQAENPNKIYTYHDSCYLGRHNGIYNAPRMVIDAIPGIKRVEMSRNRDRSFCCGGGGLALFYEPVEERRMGQVRVDMAGQAGANVIVTVCPFCLIHIEDGIKTSGMEGKMEVIDLVELIDKHLVN